MTLQKNVTESSLLVPTKAQVEKLRSNKALKIPSCAHRECQPAGHGHEEAGGFVHNPDLYSNAKKDSNQERKLRTQARLYSQKVHNMLDPSHLITNLFHKETRESMVIGTSRMMLVLFCHMSVGLGLAAGYAYMDYTSVDMSLLNDWMDCLKDVVDLLVTGIIFLLSGFVAASLNRWWAVRNDCVGELWNAMLNLNMIASGIWQTNSPEHREARELVVRYGLLCMQRERAFLRDSNCTDCTAAVAPPISRCHACDRTRCGSPLPRSAGAGPSHSDHRGDCQDYREEGLVAAGGGSRAATSAGEVVRCARLAERFLRKCALGQIRHGLRLRLEQWPLLRHRQPADQGAGGREQDQRISDMPDTLWLCPSDPPARPPDLLLQHTLHGHQFRRNVVTAPQAECRAGGVRAPLHRAHLAPSLVAAHPRRHDAHRLCDSKPPGDRGGRLPLVEISRGDGG
mmetsp:Transcript_48866/g.135572  ORF Transcript_48866/g.135572 Transcript_48866/m.135572 type:complete len:455 (-) Transcript_48866:440-1804(-)